MREHTVLMPPKHFWLRILTVVLSATAVVTLFNNCSQASSKSDPKASQSAPSANGNEAQ